jgi:hypothetical protein
MIQTQDQKIKKIFLYPPLSAIAPIIGDKKAMHNEEIATALPHRIAPSCGLEAMKSVKKVEYIKVNIIVVKGWLAKS